MGPCSQEEGSRALGIFHFPSKVWVRKPLTGGVTNRANQAGKGRIG